MTEITPNAFKKRLARNLRKENGRILRTARASDASLGPFYTVDENNVVDSYGLSWDMLLAWGNEAGLLKTGETIAA